MTNCADPPRSAPNIAVLIVTESDGDLERKSRLLIESWRTWAGSMRDVPIFSFSPRADFKPSSSTVGFLKGLNAEVIFDNLNKRYEFYPLANKPIVAAWAEENLEFDILVFIDSDQIFFNEPSELILTDGFDLAIRPVLKKNIGSEGIGDENEPYWRNLYRLCSVSSGGYLWTQIDRRKIRSYWNSGLVSVRRTEGILGAWNSNFRKVMEANLEPCAGLYFVEQSVLSATISSKTNRVWTLSCNYSYPSNYEQLEDSARIRSLDKIVSFHYHNALTKEKWRQISVPIGQDISKGSDRYKWYREKMEQLWGQTLID